MKKEVEAFLSQLRLRDASVGTAKQYAYTLGMFERFLGGDRDINSISRTDVAAFTEFLASPSDNRLHKVAYRRSSIIAVRACLSSFFQYLLDSGRVATNPMPTATRIPRPPRNPVYLTEEEKDKLLLATDTLEEKVVLCLLLSTGMRKGELLSTRVKDIDLVKGRIQVRLKRGAVRPYIIVPALVNHEIRTLVERYIRNEGLGSEDFLVHLSGRGLHYLVDRVAKRAGIQKSISPHKLRHTFAIAMRKRNVRTVDLQNLLHHKNRDTTAIYEAVDMKDTEEELTRLGLIKK